MVQTDPFTALENLIANEKAPAEQSFSRRFFQKRKAIDVPFKDLNGCESLDEYWGKEIQSFTINVKRIEKKVIAFDCGEAVLFG